jgi:FkbH-like protein
MNMFWLPKNPLFAQELAAVQKASPEATWGLLSSIAQHDLNFLETLQLDKALKKFVDSQSPALIPQTVRLALLSSSTVDHLLPGIQVGGLRRNLWISAYVADYGQSLQELVDPASALHGFKPNVVLVSVDALSIFGTQPLGLTADSAAMKLEQGLSHVQTLWRLAQEKFSCRVIHQTPLPLFHPLMGSNEHRLPDSPYHLLRVYNARLREMADAQNVDLLDLNGWALLDGLKNWHDPVLWHKAKQEVSPAAGPMYGEMVARIIAAQQGRSYKCMVLDLDNTLWGGVIGDDGLEGIKLGQGSGLGEAYVAFQRYARDLSSRGIILAVCSKNDEKKAREPFEKHPEMVLKNKDIANFVANWNDKASNLRSIAKKLNIGLDSLVFVDDNPFERGQVRAELPMVAVPELPEDPALYPACIAAGGYFESVALTEDDRARSGQYQKNLEREQVRESFTDMTQYLKSLDMELIWGPFDPMSFSRVTQLINKTNQFNLTTRRYSEEDVRRFAEDPKTITVRCRLKDRFGDNGIIGIIIAVEEINKSWRLDTWLMSCRVLGRGVERAMLDLVAQEVWNKGGLALIGEYRPTNKNGMVQDHYRNLGFEPLETVSGVPGRWVLDPAKNRNSEYLIAIKKGD